MVLKVLAVLKVLVLEVLGVRRVLVLKVLKVLVLMVLKVRSGGLRDAEEDQNDDDPWNQRPDEERTICFRKKYRYADASSGPVTAPA